MKGRPLNETYINGHAKELMQKTIRDNIRLRYSNKFLQCFERSQQRILTEVPQASTKVMKNEKEWTLLDRIATGLSLSGINGLFCDECTMKQFESRDIGYAF